MPSQTTKKTTKHSSSSNSNDDEEIKSCCTWPKILLFAVLIVIIGILIWQFAPIGEAVDSVLPTFDVPGQDNNNDGGGDGGNNNDNNNNSPTSAPTSIADRRYEFMQCDDIANGKCCNGLDVDGMCDLRVNDIMYAGVHNSMATREDGFLFGPNHEFSLEKALDAGYRGINLDVCNCGGNYVFCHGICGLGSRDITEVFESINTFVNDHPTEIIAIIFELNNGADDPIDLTTLYDNFMKPVAGFTEKLYQHPSSSPGTEWPTLRQSIQSNKRILMFHYGGQTCAATEAKACPAGLHYYLDYATNNDWQANNLAALRNTDVSCPLSRTPTEYGTTFFGINNFITPPNKNGARTANSYDFAKNRIQTCSNINGGLHPNFVLVDFWSEGDLTQITQEHNMALAANATTRTRRVLLHNDVEEENVANLSTTTTTTTGMAKGQIRRRQ